MRNRISWFLFSLVSVAALAQQPGAPPLPLDPITPGERETALKLAQSDSRVRERLGQSYRLVYVNSIAVKLTQKDDEPHGRYADVLYVRRDNDVGVRALVDLTAGRVVDIAIIGAPKVPLGIADVEDALRIALEDPNLRGLLGDRAGSFHVLNGPVTRENANSDFVEGLQTVGATPNDPCTTHRCVVLLFNSGGRLLFTDREITVDLSARATARVRVKGVK